MQRIMQGMSESMTRIAAGLWRDDYALVQTAAKGIAEHPEPSLLEKLALLGRLGGDAPRFMEADEALQSSALALVEAAAEGRPEQVLERYQQVLQRCVACHRWYRTAVEEQRRERPAYE